MRGPFRTPCNARRSPRRQAARSRSASARSQDHVMAIRGVFLVHALGGELPIDHDEEAGSCLFVSFRHFGKEFQTILRGPPDPRLEKSRDYCEEQNWRRSQESFG